MIKMVDSGHPNINTQPLVFEIFCVTLKEYYNNGHCNQNNITPRGCQSLYLDVILTADGRNVDIGSGLREHQGDGCTHYTWMPGISWH